MNYLLVDSGNHSIKWAFYTSSGLTEHGRIDSWDSDSLHAAWMAIHRPDRVVVSNVAGDEGVRAIQEFTTGKWSIEPEYIESVDACCGVKNGYAEPAQLGVDRWLAMIAAIHQASGAVIVVDCGTAVTIDLVDDSGQFRGGVIMAGLGLSRSALSVGTAALASYEPDLITPAATSTADAVVSGTLVGLAGAIERVIQEQSAMLDTEPTIFLTGGDAEQLLLLLNCMVEMQPDLVLHGLKVWIDQGKDNP